MSAEALRAVMNHSTASGPEFVVQMALAHLSKDRHGWYPKTTAKHEDIAKAARMSPSNTRHTIKRLLDGGRLFIAQKAKGQTPATYELPIRECLKRNTLECLKPDTLIREDPIRKPRAQESTAEGDPLAVPSQPSNIIRYPKPKRARKSHAG